jgi:hypothetical protein
MDALFWVVYGGIAAVGVYALAERAYRKRAWRRLVVAVYTQHPIANLAPPTVAELRPPEWVPVAQAGIDRNTYVST